MVRVADTELRDLPGVAMIAVTPWTGLLGYTVLSEDNRMHISQHKTKPGVYTTLDNILNPLWGFLTELLPRSLSPNILTFAGFLPLVISYGLAWSHSPDFQTAPPRWLFFVMAAALFMYQTLDAVDEKQATRIEHATPLGRLFAHGCDCMACLSHHSMACAILLPGASRLNLAGLAVLMTGFFMAQWEEHYTGSLPTSFGPVGVTETMYGLIGLLMFGGFLGPDALNAFMSRPVLGDELRNVLVQLWILFSLVLIGICFYKTMTYKSKDEERRARGEWVAPSIAKSHEALDRPKALLALCPILLLNFMLVWGWHSAVITSMPRWLCLSAGLLNFFLTGKMIICNMACEPFSAFQPAGAPFVALAVASVFAYLPFEMTAVQITLGIHTLALGFHVKCWLITVIWELKAHLGIEVFTVKKKDD